MGSLISTAGPVGLLSLVVVLILTGHLVPRSSMLDVMRQRDKWEQAAREEAAGRREDRDQVSQLLTVARVADRVLTSLPQPEEVGHGTADVDEAAAP
jgi:hypothetical protein